MNVRCPATLTLTTVAGGSSCLAAPQFSSSADSSQKEKRLEMAAVPFWERERCLKIPETLPESLAPKAWTFLEHPGKRGCRQQLWARLPCIDTRHAGNVPQQEEVIELVSSDAMVSPEHGAAGKSKGRAMWVSPLMAEDSSCLRVSVVSSLGMFPTYSLCFDCEGATRSCKAQISFQVTVAITLQGALDRLHLQARQTVENVCYCEPCPDNEALLGAFVQLRRLKQTCQELHCAESVRNSRASE